MVDTRLSIFPDEFVASIEGSTYYPRWAKANPGELAKWEAFRDAVIAGQQLTPPILSTKFGKALVAAGKEHMAVSQVVGSVTNPYPTVNSAQFVSSSITALQTLSGTVSWSVVTLGPVTRVEFWANNAQIGSDSTPPSPFTFALDTTQFANGANTLGVVLVASDGSRIAVQIGTVTVNNLTGTLLWNADLSTGNRSQYGDWEYAGTFSGTPPISDRVAVASSLDGFAAPLPGGYVMRVTCAPGDTYGGSTGWRTMTRLPPEYTNGGNIVLRSPGYDSSYTWAVLVPPGWPGDATIYVSGIEWHHTGTAGLSVHHSYIYANNMFTDVYDGTNYWVNQTYLNGYTKGAWYVFTERYVHGVAPNGHYELWYGQKGVHTSMQQLIYSPNITTVNTLAGPANNYMLFGLYRNNTGSSTINIYFGGYREYSTLAAAKTWGETILNS